MQNKHKCSVCENTDTQYYKVVYSTNPFGEDADHVYLCQRHALEANGRYEVYHQDEPVTA